MSAQAKKKTEIELSFDTSSDGSFGDEASVLSQGVESDDQRTMAAGQTSARPVVSLDGGFGDDLDFGSGDFNAGGFGEDTGLGDAGLGDAGLGDAGLGDSGLGVAESFLGEGSAPEHGVTLGGSQPFDLGENDSGQGASENNLSHDGADFSSGTDDAPTKAMDVPLGANVEMADPFVPTQGSSYPSLNGDSPAANGLTYGLDELPGDPEFALPKSSVSESPQVSLESFAGVADFGANDDGSAAMLPMGTESPPDSGEGFSELFAGNSEIGGFTLGIEGGSLDGEAGAALDGAGEGLGPTGATRLENLTPGWQPDPNAPALVKPPSRIRGARFGALFALLRWSGVVAVAVLFATVALVFGGTHMMSEDELRGLSGELGLTEVMEWAGTFESFEVPAPPPPPPAPVVKETKTIPRASEANRAYFESIEGAIAQGDPSRAVSLMREGPPNLLSTPEDLDLASMVSGRFFLFVGNPKRAERVLQSRCSVKREDLSISVCLPLVRAHIALGQLDKATRLLESLEKRSDALEWAESISHAKKALKTRRNLTPVSVAEHLSYFFSQVSGNLEWERQQGLWLVQEIGLLGNRRWRDLSLQVFTFFRDDLVSRLRARDAVGPRLRHAQALTRLLDWLAVRYDFEALPFEHGQRTYPTKDMRIATVLQALSQNESQDADDRLRGLHRLRGKAPFSEIERLLNVNVAAQDADWGRVFHILNAQIPKLPRSRYSFEWKLVGALYAIGTDDFMMASQLQRALDAYARTNAGVLEVFDYWYVMARLAQFLEVSPVAAIAKARELAAGPRELGLVESVQLEFLSRSSGRRPLNIDAVVQKYPWHDRVLQAAIMASGRQGLDPSRFIEMQSRVSQDKLALGREKNLLLDATIEDLIMNM